MSLNILIYMRFDVNFQQTIRKNMILRVIYVESYV